MSREFCLRIALPIANRTTDINRSIIPITRVPIATSVEGTEKYLVSLKMSTTTTEKVIPMAIKTKLGIPR